MIPKVIHYCWFGNNDKNELIIKCIDSWKMYLPDYQIMEWNDDNFDFNLNPFLKEAYHKKKWAFVSDYVRSFVLYHYGGIYLDTDVQIKQSLNQFLHHGAFSGFESKGYPFTALWGAQKHHVWPKKVLDYYHTKNNFEEVTNTIIVTKLLIDTFNADPNKDELQLLIHNVAVYPSSYFCLDLPSNFASHHFNGSWLGFDSEYKIKLHKMFYSEQYKKSLQSKSILEDLYDTKVVSFSQFFSFTSQLARKQIKNKIFKFFKK